MASRMSGVLKKQFTSWRGFLARAPRQMSEGMKGIHNGDISNRACDSASGLRKTVEWSPLLGVGVPWLMPGGASPAPTTDSRKGTAKAVPSRWPQTLTRWLARQGRRAKKRAPVGGALEYRIQLSNSKLFGPDGVGTSGRPNHRRLGLRG